jgi:hypothetical protein
MAEKSSWDQANIRQKLDLVCKNRKKISQIIKDYFYLPFFLLIILWRSPFVLERTRIMALCVRHQMEVEGGGGGGGIYLNISKGEMRLSSVITSFQTEVSFTPFSCPVYSRREACNVFNSHASLTN